MYWYRSRRRQRFVGWQNVAFFLCIVIKCLNGILRRFQPPCFMQFLCVSHSVCISFKRITCFQLISLIISLVYTMVILKSTVLRVEVSFYLQCGSIFAEWRIMMFSCKLCYAIQWDVVFFCCWIKNDNDGNTKKTLLWNCARLWYAIFAKRQPVANAIIMWFFFHFYSE